MMIRKSWLRMLLLTFSGSTLAVGGCSAVFDEEFRAFMATTATSTATAVGTFIVEAAVDSVFD